MGALETILALAVVVAVAHVLGAIATRLGQPRVIGEIAAGIGLGPSLFGWIAPHVSAAIFPASVVPRIGVVADAGVIVFMFLVGLEIDASALRSQARSTLAISQASIAAPFGLGALLAWQMHDSMAHDVPRVTFILFVAVAMSVTAFPVLARILGDLGMKQTKLGTLALACAAVDDVIAWCLLAAVVSLARAEGHAGWIAIALVSIFVASMFLVVRPLVKRAARFDSRVALAIAIVGIPAAAWTTHAIGVHALFGAFLFGAVMPHDALVMRAAAKVSTPVTIFLLPIFFALSGLRTRLGLVHGTDAWTLCALVVIVASTGKIGGTAIAARITGLGWRDATTVGVLMNTRGLMELVVLNVGLDLHVISEELFAILVVMAVLTTFATAPLLRILRA